MDLEVQEVMLTEEQVCGMHPFDGRDLLAQLEGIRARVNEIEGECAIKIGQLL
jgi:hypothetical protein